MFKQKNNKPQWLQLAAELNMEFKEGINAFLESENLISIAGLQKDFAAKDIRQLKELLQKPFISMMIKSVFIGNVVGKYRDYEFHLFRSRSNSSSSSNNIFYVNIILLFKNSYNYGMEITRAGFGSGLAKTLFKKHHAHIPNNQILDKMLKIKGKNIKQIQTLLSDTTLQEKLWAIYESGKNITITDNGIRLKQQGEIISKDVAIKTMKIMADTADRFY